MATIPFFFGQFITDGLDRVVQQINRRGQSLDLCEHLSPLVRQVLMKLQPDEFAAAFVECSRLNRTSPMPSQRAICSSGRSCGSEGSAEGPDSGSLESRRTILFGRTPLVERQVMRCAIHQRRGFPHLGEIYMQSHERFLNDVLCQPAARPPIEGRKPNRGDSRVRTASSTSSPGGSARRWLGLVALTPCLALRLPFISRPSQHWFANGIIASDSLTLYRTLS